MKWRSDFDFLLFSSFLIGVMVGLTLDLVKDMLRE